MQKLNEIESFEIKLDEISLKEKMKKLDDLDTYTRTNLKEEIATDRENYFTYKKNTLVNDVDARLKVKTSLQDVNKQYDNIIKHILKNLSKVQKINI